MARVDHNEENSRDRSYGQSSQKDICLPMSAQALANSTPASNSSPILEAKTLTHRFGGLVAVNQVSFAVQENEIFGLIGPNGAGKTTLFNLMTGLLTPSSGQLLYRGYSIAKLRPYRIAAKGIARTFQNLRLFGELSALENVMIARHIHTQSGLLTGILGLPLAVREEAQTKQQALELLELIHLSERADQKACNFSYGDQRRLEIARALALKPQVLLLDEPAAGMNEREKHQLSEFIRELRW
ncbi:MAG TPA: ABC transporter ATP-binding protein, partial [Candidatus Caenarcaniphilales bacterium]